MSARPYDMTAYSPAVKTAAIPTATRFWTVNTSSTGAAASGRWRPGSVLHHHIGGPRNVPVGLEPDDSAREQRIAEDNVRQGVPDLRPLKAPRLTDGGEEDTGGVVGQRLEPVGHGMVLPHVPLGEQLGGRVFQGRRPPQRRDQVVSPRPQRLASLLVGAARPVRHHLVVEAQLKVLAVHRDEVRQVGIGEEYGRVGGLHLLEEGTEVASVKLEGLVQDNPE